MAHAITSCKNYRLLQFSKLNIFDFIINRIFNLKKKKMKMYNTLF